MRSSALVAIALTFAATAPAALADPGDRVAVCHQTGSEANPVVTITVAPSAVAAHLAHGDQLAAGGLCLGSATFCGGFAGIPCEPGETCIDDPRDDCEPACGGADCGGICVTFPPPAPCDGPAGCPDGLECIDDPGDDCNPDCGDTGCPTLCLPVGATCGGFAGDPCPLGLECIDLVGDGCHPDCGGADCLGICADLAPIYPCGGPDDIGCPGDSVCVDDPRDACGPTCGGVDCPGICVIPS